MNKIPVSVVVLTKNEENNLAECLDSVKGWADEILVVDDLSTDHTVSIAQKLADKVLIKKMEIEGTHRNWAYSQAENSWVLSLDADEKVTDELKSEIARVLADTECVSFSIPLRNYIGSTWVRHGGWYPAGKVRLFRKDKFRYEEVVVHPRAFIDGTCGHLKGDIVHKGYPDFEHFLASLNRQSTLEAKKWIMTERRMSGGRIAWRAVDRLFRRYIGRGGYKDGFIGFMVAFFDMLYQVMSYAKYRQMLLETSDNEEQKRETVDEDRELEDRE
jgi:glycosyltransferase involved in cell wall biosynthesis